MGRKIRIIDTTLRDGMHAVSHQFSPDDMAEIAKSLDEAGVDTIEIGHGDGLGGSSFQYGFSAYSDEDYVTAVSKVLKNAKLDVLLLPGIGTKKELEAAAKYGAKVARVATHVTEADVGEQHIKLAKDLGMEAVGFLMMTHMADVKTIVEQAKLFASYGADTIYVTDSAGALTPQGVFERIKAVKEATGLPIGHHAHNNLGLAVANTLAAIEAGADLVDATCKGLGAGAGNTQIEVLVAVLHKLGYETGIDLYKIMDVADDVVVPKMKRPIVIDKNSLTIGYAGVYGSFLLHALRAAEKFGVDARDILFEMGQRRTVGGQEDMIVDVAYELSKNK
ncbi:MAG: 4-hydroxy-2-oxopentanoic acid aldolase [Peptococcaceae bacterium BICA1-8]|nr:MAG: 4-hydroxy-2-oxopentanoic acid aldolase [Peptococcaceae bacterium BICA1-8]